VGIRRSWLQQTPRKPWHGYVEALFRLYGSAVSNQVISVLLVREGAAKRSEQQKSKRAGLLATQAIAAGRTGVPRRSHSGGILFAI